MNQYEKMTDEELILLYKQGDKKAINFLVEKNKNLVTSIVHSNNFFLSGGEIEDLIQFGMLALFEAAVGFNEERNVKFRTYATYCIKNKMISAINSGNSKKNQPLNNSVPFSSPVKDEDANLSYEDVLMADYGRNPEDLIISDEQVNFIRNKLRTETSELEKKVFSLHTKDLSYGQIAKQLNISEKAVDNAIQRIRKKIAEYI